MSVAGRDGTEDVDKLAKDAFPDNSAAVDLIAQLP